MTGIAVHVQVSALTHRYGQVTALDDVSVAVPAGSMLALVGESGSGKSTLLRTINRTTVPTSGRVLLDDQDVSREEPVALRRRIGYVPQSGGLLPHWTVLRNVALVPTLNAHADPASAARDALDRCGLSPAIFATRYPHELSGGQRQRVALARALAARQGLILLDESFSALDAISRSELLESFATIRASLGFTALLVTHDLGEAARLADRIAVMRAGRIEQVGSLHELLEQPRTPYVAALVERARSTARLLADA
ncbi:MAG: ATP-binding cassette domain-containing protein [Gemmatimonadaceae bacterium]